MTPDLPGTPAQTGRSVVLVCGTGLLAETLCELLLEVEPGLRARLVSASDLAAVDPLRLQESALVLVDRDRLDAGGDQALTDLACAYPSTRIVAIGTTETGDVADRLLAGGLCGYIPKSNGRAAFIGILRLILSGVCYRPASTPAVADAAERGVPWAGARIPSLADDFGLTPAEIAVVRLGARGLTNREIADARGRSEGVVRVQFNAIFRKLGVRNRAEAMLIALRSDELVGHDTQDGLDLDSLLAHVAHRRCKSGETLFCRGDPGEEVFVVQRGEVLLPELGVRMQPRDVFGEIGAFSPGHRRTCSAVCVTDTDLFVIPPDVARRVYCLDPRFAVFIRDLLARRLMADRAVTS